MICSNFIKDFNVKNPFPIFFICSIFFLFLFSSPYTSTGYSNVTFFNATVTKIIDGDTFEISTLGRKKTIRLWGVDTPEWDQPFSNKAKKFLINTLLRQQLIVQPRYYDKFGRLIATVFLKNYNFNQLLVEKGFAWVHIYYCNEEICLLWRRLEKNARENRIGLWSQSHPVPPWQWKKK